MSDIMPINARSVRRNSLAFGRSTSSSLQLRDAAFIRIFYHDLEREVDGHFARSLGYLHFNAFGRQRKQKPSNGNGPASGPRFRARFKVSSRARPAMADSNGRLMRCSCAHPKAAAHRHMFLRGPSPAEKENRPAFKHPRPSANCGAATPILMTQPMATSSNRGPISVGTSAKNRHLDPSADELDFMITHRLMTMDLPGDSEDPELHHQTVSSLALSSHVPCGADGETSHFQTSTLPSAEPVEMGEFGGTCYASSRSAPTRPFQLPPVDLTRRPIAQGSLLSLLVPSAAADLDLEVQDLSIATAIPCQPRGPSGDGPAGITSLGPLQGPPPPPQYIGYDRNGRPYNYAEGPCTDCHVHRDPGFSQSPRLANDREGPVATAGGSGGTLGLHCRTNPGLSQSGSTAAYGYASDLDTCWPEHAAALYIGMHGGPCNDIYI